MFGTKYSRYVWRRPYLLWPEKKNIRIILYFLKEKTSGAEVARMRQSKEP
jgi:hypothetical protein